MRRDEILQGLSEWHKMLLYERRTQEKLQGRAVRRVRDLTSRIRELTRERDKEQRAADGYAENVRRLADRIGVLGEALCLLDVDVEPDRDHEDREADRKESGEEQA